MTFFTHLKSLIQFLNLPPSKRKIVFYSEGINYWSHLEGLIVDCLKNKNIFISYLTSDKLDPGLKFKNDNFLSFNIGEGNIRTWLFRNIDAKVMILTMPDIENYQIKKSRFNVHYIYVQHSLVSTHMVYRSGAFNHYDTIFCSGPHHIKEIREMEKKFNTKTKNLVKHGYSRISKMINNIKTNSNKHISKKVLDVLIAPSWGESGVVETFGFELVDILLKAGLRVTLRPHPETIKHSSDKIDKIIEKFKKEKFFCYENNVLSFRSFFDSDIMITDWSGSALEYGFAFQKPIIFMDVPMKVNNPEYKIISSEPIEIGLRSKLGKIVQPNDLQKLPNLIPEMINEYKNKSKSISINKYIFNLHKQDKIGADFIIKLSTQ